MLVECGSCEDDVEHFLGKGAAMRRFSENKQKILHGESTEDDKTAAAQCRFDQLSKPRDSETCGQIVIQFALTLGFIPA